MTQINIKKVIKGLSYFSITLACLTFVVWQCEKCIEKYIDNPQGTKLSLKYTGETKLFPEITICGAFNNGWDYGYKAYRLQRCGIR